MKLEKNIPLPETRGRRPTYPFAEMEVGDSFEVEIIGREPLQRARNRAFNAARQHGLLHGKKFAVRTFADSARIWRVA